MAIGIGSFMRFSWGSVRRASWWSPQPTNTRAESSGWNRKSSIRGPVGGHPADAIVLFDGKDLSQWNGGQDWEIRDGYAIGRKHGISTKEAFGDCQLHIEWATPAKVEGSGQGRGNSGVYLMGLYEVQILDSYDNKTYFDGQAGAIYKQHPPMVNVCRKPGEWQSYDIIFNGPRFDADGTLKRPGYVTVLQNGVVIQNHTEILGATYYERPPKYEAHPPKLPLQLAVSPQCRAVPQHLDPGYPQTVHRRKIPRKPNPTRQTKCSPRSRPGRSRMPGVRGIQALVCQLSAVRRSGKKPGNLN